MNYEALDEALAYLNEGIFSKKKKEEPKPEESKKEFKIKLAKAQGSIFDKLYNNDAYCAEGMSNPDKMETAEMVAKHIQNNWEDAYGDTIYFYWCKGKDLNTKYHLTGHNAYPADLGIFFIDWASSFDNRFSASAHKGKFRYFSDVVINNAAREEKK